MHFVLSWYLHLTEKFYDNTIVSIYESPNDDNSEYQLRNYTNSDFKENEIDLYAVDKNFILKDLPVKYNNFIYLTYPSYNINDPQRHETLPIVVYNTKDYKTYSKVKIRKKEHYYLMKTNLTDSETTMDSVKLL